MYKERAIRSLCYYDNRNPTRDEHGTRDAEDPQPGQRGCGCDNCHNGRHPLATIILDLLEGTK
jgi:hypothetical protein